MSGSDIAISARGLGKRYQIGGVRAPYRTVRESVTDAVATPFRRLTRRGRAAAAAADAGTTLWALRDVGFEVPRGQAVGIVGRNGAGKSTLLKVLSRITDPSTGSVELAGRVGSLLEVGTGFHPELTGRENIYLNGAILGMPRADIRKKFDEIVAFSEVERFLDTPVKRYSSGMYTRLAFAVAAHMDTEILIVDEVLAVGDATFQKKCLGKMGEVAGGGRTVLFVSHNMGAVANLCQRAILLADGKVRQDGPAADVIAAYIRTGAEDSSEVVWADPAAAPGNHNVRLRAVRVVSEGRTTSDVRIDRPVTVQIDFATRVPGLRASASIHLLDAVGGCVLASINLDSANAGRDEWAGRPCPAGTYRTECVLPANFLNEGQYAINAFVLTDVTRIEAQANNVVSFVVQETGEMRKEYNGPWIGSLRPRLAWQTVRCDDDVV